MALSEKTIEHKHFGKISVVKSSRASRISISMKPFEPIRLTIPVLVSSKRAEEFLQQKEKWILRNLEKIQKLEKSHTVFDEQTEFRTREHELEIERVPDASPLVILRQNKILIKLPEGSKIADPEIQELIRGGIIAAWRKEAKKRLPPRLDELSRLNGFKYERVFIKNNRSRWGSCSHKNNLNLNLHLMRLPDHLIDYVLLHELVHTVHKNHSERFWNKLEEVFPGARLADRELKEYRIDIY